MNWYRQRPGLYTANDYVIERAHGSSDWNARYEGPVVEAVISTRRLEDAKRACEQHREARYSQIEAAS